MKTKNKEKAGININNTRHRNRRDITGHYKTTQHIKSLSGSIFPPSMTPIFQFWWPFYLRLSHQRTYFYFHQYISYIKKEHHRTIRCPPRCAWSLNGELTYAPSIYSSSLLNFSSPTRRRKVCSLQRKKARGQTRGTLSKLWFNVDQEKLYQV